MASTSVAWHYADIFEAVAAAAPDRVVIVHGERRLTWRSFDERANALAADLVAAGVGRQGKVMTYLYNSPEYLETAFGSLKAALVPVNVNYRYGPDEIRYLFENADAEAAVFDVAFAPLLDEIRNDLPLMKRWLAVGDRAAVPDWATPYEDAASSGAAAPELEWSRHPDDLIMVYTGGTTGMPKGVMWTQSELFQSMGKGGNAAWGLDGVDSMQELSERIAAPGSLNQIVLEACPLMHATALGHSFAVLPAGATIVLLDGNQFDAAQLWDEVERNEVNWLTMVGDAFGRPLLAELEASPGRWNLESLGIVHSAGVMWSQEVKDGFLRHLRSDAMLLDALGSTEAPGLGSSVSTSGDSAATAKFTIGEFAQVITEDDRFAEPGSGEIGMVGFGGHMPLGYYKDEEKTASTFRMVGGQRWSIPGDFATVEVDGTLTLLGRGSVCINTGGEKVFPEEVEEILKLHDSVRDAVCVGIPDDRFGQRVCAVVEVEPGLDAPALSDLADLTKSRLAGYKAPRDLVVVDTIGRAPSGKVNYKGLTAHAVAELGA
jgi:acyl-CoA synthetase (AMP-forming)/AMP-acid ligase II